MNRTPPTQMFIADIRGELSDIFTRLYEDEPEENYDLDGAREYWRCLSRPELEAELIEAREREARSLAT